MSTSKKHLIADAGIEHDTPEYIPVRRNDPSTPESAGVVNTAESETDSKIPTDVMPDWEEL